MNTGADSLALRKVARLAGGSYVVYIVAMVLADVLGHVGRGTSEQIYQSIVGNEGSFRLGLVFAFLSASLFLLTAWGLYVLLRPVSKNLALLFLLLNTVGVAVQCASLLPLLSALLQGDSASHLQAFSAAQLEGMAYLSVDVYKTGFVTAQLFFGTWLFPLGYLVYKSRFLPRFLGVLLVLDGIAVLIWFLQSLLLPDYAAIRYPGLLVSFVAEVGLALWLLFMGARVDDPAAGVPRGTSSSTTQTQRPQPPSRTNQEHTMSQPSKESPPLPPRWFIRSFWVAQRALYSVTRGRLGLRTATADRWGMMRLHTVGRRTGEERVAILGYFEDGPDLVTMAMNGWADPEPAWWLNLQARPDTIVDLPSGPRAVHAHAANKDERPRLWAMQATYDRDLDGYAARRSKETAVVILSPRPE